MTPQEGTPVPEREDEIVHDALAAGFMISTGYGQAAGKLMPVSDRATLEAFGKAQRDRGSKETFARWVEDTLKDEALLREALEALEGRGHHEEVCCWGGTTADDKFNTECSCGLEAAINNLKARLSPKESGGQGRAGG